MVIRERHLLQPFVLDGRGMAGMANESSLCSCIERVVGLNLSSTKLSMVVSYLIIQYATVTRSPHNPDRSQHSKYFHRRLQLDDRRVSVADRLNQ